MMRFVASNVKVRCGIYSSVIQFSNMVRLAVPFSHFRDFTRVMHFISGKRLFNILHMDKLFDVPGGRDSRQITPILFCHFRF